MTNPDTAPESRLDNPSPSPAQAAQVEAGNRMISEVQSSGYNGIASPELAALASHLSGANFQPTGDVMPVSAPSSENTTISVKPAAVSGGDAQYSIEQLEKSGVMQKASPDAMVAPGADEVRVANETRGIEQVEQGQRTQPVKDVQVQLSDQPNDPSQRINDPDFRILKDGTIQVLHDPDKTNKQQLVVDVQRDQGDVGPPTEAQQKAADGLVSYLTQRYMQQNADGTKAGAIEDPQGLISDQTKMQTKAELPPESVLPQPTQQEIQNMNRFNGGGRGSLSPEQVQSYFPQRDVPRDPGESVRTAAVKDMIAGMENVGTKEPYTAERNLGDRGWGVGRYLLTYDLLNQWMTDLVGDPPDPAKMAELAKTNPKLAAFLQSAGFKHLLEKLKNGEQPTADDIKQGLPKEMQETIAGQLIQKFADATKDANGNVDAGKVALAFHLGHAPSDAEAQKAENQSFVQAADKLYGLAEWHNERPNQGLDWQNAPSQSDSKGQATNNKILLAARAAIGHPIWANSKFSAQDLQYGNLGCAASVSEVFRAAGDNKVYSASVDGVESQLKRDGYSMTRNPQPGDVAIFTKGGVGHHVGIMDYNNVVLNNSSAAKKWVARDLNTEMQYGGFTGVKFYHKVDQPSEQNT